MELAKALDSRAMNDINMASTGRGPKAQGKVTPKLREVIFASVRRHLPNGIQELSTGDFLAVLHECGYGDLTVAQAEGLTKAFFDEEAATGKPALENFSDLKSGIRISLKRRVKIASDLKRRFERTGAKPTLGGVASVLKAIGHTKLTIRQVKIIREEVLDSAGLPDFEKLKLDEDFQVVARELAHYFVQHTKYRPKRIEIQKVCESKGYNVPYWRTGLLRSMIFHIAPALAKRPPNDRDQRVLEQPKVLKSNQVLIRTSITLNVRARDLLRTYAGARGYKSRLMSQPIEELTLMVAYGLVSGKLNLAALLPSAVNMSDSDFEMALKLLQRSVIKGM